MIVRHVPCQSDPTACSATDKSWVYRTEVENTNDRPIRVVWLEFYYQDGDAWFGANIRKRVLRNPDFADWYSDGADLDDGGWLAPGSVAACDPNYCPSFSEKITPVKWCFIAVDAEGNDYFAGAIVGQDAVALNEPP